jgi:hypothetical protein
MASLRHGFSEGISLKEPSLQIATSPYTRGMGIVLLGMFLPILALSVFSLVLSVRARRGKIKPDAAWVFLFIQIIVCFLVFNNAVGGEAYLREVWVFFANFLITGILVCAVVMFTPRSKVLKKYM